MKSSSWILLGGAALIGGLIESSFAGSAPFPFSHIRPLLPGIAILVLLKRQQASFVAAGIAGAVSDLIKVDSSAFAVARWLLLAFIADFVSEKIITNRSLSAAWMMMIILRVLDYLFLLVSYWLSPLLLQRSIYIETWKDYLMIGFFDLVIVSLLFVGFTLFTRRFLISVPLTKNKYDR